MCYMYSRFSTLSQILLKNSFEKVVFKFWPRDGFRERKIQFFGRHLEMVHILIFFFCFMIVLGLYMVRCMFRTKIPTGKYLKMIGSKWTPLCTNGSEKKLKHLKC